MMIHPMAKPAAAPPDSPPGLGGAAVAVGAGAVEETWDDLVGVGPVDRVPIDDCTPDGPSAEVAGVEFVLTGAVGGPVGTAEVCNDVCVLSVEVTCPAAVVRVVGPSGAPGLEVVDVEGPCEACGAILDQNFRR